MGRDAGAAAGHSSVVLTADTYLSVAVELGLKSAADAARLVLKAGKRPPGGGDQVTGSIQHCRLTPEAPMGAGLRSALVLIRLIYLFMVRVFGWLARRCREGRGDLRTAA